MNALPLLVLGAIGIGAALLYSDKDESKPAPRFGSKDPGDLGDVPVNWELPYPPEPRDEPLTHKVPSGGLLSALGLDKPGELVNRLPQFGDSYNASPTEDSYGYRAAGYHTGGCSGCGE